MFPFLNICMSSMWSWNIFPYSHLQKYEVYYVQMDEGYALITDSYYHSQNEKCSLVANYH